MKLINIFAKKEINFTHPIKIITILVIMIPLISIISINMLNLNFGIDLIGGLEFHVKFNKFIKISEINKLLNELNLYKNKIQHYGNQTTNEMLIKIEKPSNIILKQTKYIKKYLATYSNKHNFLNISDITINKKSHDNMLLKLNINKTLKNNNFFIFNTIIENKHIIM